MNAIEERYILNREIGDLGLSIATDLAISRALGKHPEIKDPSPPIDRYGKLLINLRTLVRNFFGAIDYTVRKQIKPQSVTNKLVDELAVIVELIGGNKVSVYYNTYNGVAKRFPKAEIRKLTSPLQLDNAMQEEKATLLLIAMLESKGALVLKYDVDIGKSDNFPKTLLLTSYPIDLLSSNNFATVDLLESHTGAIKPKLQWYTKLSKFKSERVIVPFSAFTLQIFGDGVLFSSKDTKVKEAVMATAVKYKWTPATTEDRVRWAISNIPNASYRDEISLLL